MFGYCQVCGEQPTTAGCGCNRVKVWINGVPANPAAVVPQQGWQCPGCQRYVSPYANTCPACEPPVYTVQYGTLQPVNPWLNPWQQQPRNWTFQGDTEET